MTEKTVSECPKCGARWVDGQLYWSTGKEGCPHDLAGLVCNNYGDDRCVNPCKGSDSGDTWEKRAGMIRKLGKEEKDL
tara:strand:- start:191 stop:424 length:234 start_codon:yes stop_codon:yes gene_type:complete